MANVKLNPVFEGFSNKVGELVFYNRNGKTYARRKGERTDPASPEQLEVRSTFTELTTDWGSVNGPMHRGWDKWAEKKGKRGHNAYISENFSKQRSGEPVELFKPMGDLNLDSFTAGPGGGSGEITCEFSHNETENGIRLYLFTKKRENGLSTGEIVMHEGGKNTGSPFTITGLEAGAEYAVYAVLTDGKYNEAEQVSASMGTVCLTGA